MSGDCKTSDDGVLSCPMEDILAGDIGIIYGHAESFLSPKGKQILTSTSYDLTSGLGNMTPRKTRYNDLWETKKYQIYLVYIMHRLYNAKLNKILQ